MYCCFLKQINFKNVYVKTIQLREVFEQIPVISNVNIVLTTGNIVFKSDKNIKYLHNTIKQALFQYFNYQFDIFIKPIEEIKTQL